MSHQQWRAEVSTGCIGAGFCVAIAPDHFEFSSGRAQRRERPVDSEKNIRLIRAAADVCPAAAISISGN